MNKTLLYFATCLFAIACGSDEAIDDPIGPIKLATYNVGLAHGAVAFAAERRPEIVNALKGVNADVLCLQEVWTDDDYQTLADGLKATFPYVFRKRTEDTSEEARRCLSFEDLQSLESCVNEQCAPVGISTSPCVAGPCKSEYDKLPDDCKRCLAANTADPILCAFGAKEYVYEGRNGLALFSKLPLRKPRYVAFDTLLVKRGAIVAKVGGRTIECTHLSSDLGVVPYPTDRQFASWTDEHAGQLAALSENAEGCTVLMGDLNTGPATGELVGELADNYAQLEGLGFSDPWQEPLCSWCSDNPLTGADADSWIDHIMLKDCEAESATHTRILDQPLVVTNESNEDVTTRLSDHYGVLVELGGPSVAQ